MNFYLENGNVSGKVRNALKAEALVNLKNELASAGYYAEGNSLYLDLGVDEPTGNPVRVRVDLVVTDR